MTNNITDITRRFTMDQMIGKRFASKLNLGSGVSCGSVKDAIVTIMRSRGGSFYSMTAEELINAVNCLTIYDKLCA